MVVLLPNFPATLSSISQNSKCHFSLLSRKVSCKCSSNKHVWKRVIGHAPEISSSGKSSEMLCPPKTCLPGGNDRLCSVSCSRDGVCKGNHFVVTSLPLQA